MQTVGSERLEHLPPEDMHPLPVNKQEYVVCDVIYESQKEPISKMSTPSAQQQDLADTKPGEEYGSNLLPEDWAMLGHSQVFGSFRVMDAMPLLWHDDF